MLKTKKKLNPMWIPTAASTASLLLLGGCKDDDNADENSTSLLMGEWEMTEAGGEEVEGEYYGYTYALTFEFQSDGDFYYCLKWDDTDLSAYNSCIDGEWEWKKEGSLLAIIMESNNTSYETDITITKLTETKLEGYWEDSNGDDYTIVMEKL